MKRFVILLNALMLVIATTVVYAQELPPKAADEVYMIVQPGMCGDGLIEIGTYKPGVDQSWTRNPRKFVSPCEIFVEKEFVGRYRLAARCVDATTKAPRSNWVRSLSGLGKPWPAECPGFLPGAPVNPVIPEN